MGASRPGIALVLGSLVGSLYHGRRSEPVPGKSEAGIPCDFLHLLRGPKMLAFAETPGAAGCVRWVPNTYQARTVNSQKSVGRMAAAQDG